MARAGSPQQPADLTMRGMRTDDLQEIVDFMWEHRFVFFPPGSNQLNQQLMIRKL